MNVTATIDGLPVLLEEWQADSVINWGHRTLTALTPETTRAEQETPIRLWLEDGTELWAGRLTQDPDPVRGRLRIRAEGYATSIAAAKNPLLFRHDGGEGWSDHDDDPYDGLTSSMVQFNVDPRPGGLHFILDSGVALTVGDNAGAAFWADGASITRVRYIFHRAAAGNANLDVRTNSFTGPAGGLTLINDYVETSATPSTNAFNVTLPEDAIDIRLRCNTGFTPAVKHHVWLTGLRVYGRTIDDEFSASEVVTEVGTNAGLDTSGVRANQLPVLPIYWTDHHPGLLDHMAELTDWHWEVFSPAELSFGPWEVTWTGSDSGIRTDWENQRRYNRVRVPFQRLSGAPAEVVAEPAVDPFPGSEVTYFTDELPHRQPDSTLAQAYAQAQVEYWASARVGGRVEIGEVTSATGARTDGFHVKPGHLLNVTERTDLGPQRIVGMTYRSSGLPVAEINDEFNAIRLLASLQRRLKKKKGKP